MAGVNGTAIVLLLLAAALAPMAFIELALARSTPWLYDDDADSRHEVLLISWQMRSHSCSWSEREMASVYDALLSLMVPCDDTSCSP